MGKIQKENFLLIGISHKTAPIEIRENFSYTCNQISHGAAEKAVIALEGIRECVVLSTCNRTEIYAVINKPFNEVRERIERYILDISGRDKNFLKYFYCLQGTEIIEHLFAVTSGLDSMIVGEPQIFGQVKNAYSSACDNACAGPAINRLFHHSFRVGKQIRNITSVGEGIVSVSSAASALARKIFSSLETRSVLLVGAGKIGELCAKQLTDTGIKQLYIANRTPERAEALAQKLSGTVIPFETMEDLYETVDIIITSVTSPEPLITGKSLSGHMQQRRRQPLVLIDLGVPRNIKPDTADIETVHLFNIDNLEEVTLDNRDRRKQEVGKARKIIKKEVDTFCAWIEERETIPVIHDLRNNCENIRLEELEKLKNRVSPEEFEIIDIITRRIVRKILHNPTIAVRESESGDLRKQLIDSIYTLFIENTEK